MNRNPSWLPFWLMVHVVISIHSLTSRCYVHWAISECHSHPLRFCVAFTHIQHQGSLSSVTSPSANQQPAIHKSGTSGEVDRIGQLCLDAHLPIRCQHMGICARSARHTNLRVSMSVPLSILYLLIINLMEFLKVWAKHNFTIYGIYQCIFSLDILSHFQKRQW